MKAPGSIVLQGRKTIAQGFARGYRLSALQVWRRWHRAAIALAASGLLAISTCESLANRQAIAGQETNYIAFGQQLQTNMAGATVAIFSVDQTGSGRSASGILWDPYHIVTAAHAKVSASSTNTMLEVRFGPNAYSNDCQVAKVANVVVHPSWNFTHDGESLDVALVTLSTPIYGSNAIVASVPPSGTYVSGCGFGGVLTMDGVEPPYDGFIRGWTTRVTSQTGSGFNPINHMRTAYSQVLSGPLPGGGWEGDSGGPTFDATGKVIGINVSYTATATYSVRADVAQPWIESVIAAEPPQILSCVPEGNDIRIRWRTSPGVTNAMQASSSVADTNLFTDISGPMTLPGPGSGILEYVDSGALTNSPTRFYRIRRIGN